MKFYTYEYRDPRDHTPIYVGEGSGSRAYNHLKKAGNPGLATAIFELRALGLEPIVDIVKYFATKSEACDAEEKLISQYGRRITGEGTLFNILPRSGGTDGEILRLLWTDPEYRKRYENHLLRLNTDLEIKERYLEGIRRRETNPKYRERYLEGIHRRETNQEYYKQRNEVLHRLRTDPDFLKRRNEAAKEGTRRYWERWRQEKEKGND
jgi:Uncharacterized protein conserved in bacteria